jgi:hypothetical protein
MDLLSYSDIAAAVSGAAFAQVFGNSGSTQDVAVRSLVVSIVARILSKNATLTNTIPVLNEDAKNQLCVAVLNAVYAYYKRQNMARVVLSGVSIDLIGAEILRTLNLNDTVLFSTASIAPVKP